MVFLQMFIRVAGKAPNDGVELCREKGDMATLGMI